MQGNSRPVSSNQAEADFAKLDTLLHRYHNSEFKKPIPDFIRQQFHIVDELVSTASLPLVLDSGCGNGSSTRNLAKQYPDKLILGIDKSAVRLGLTSHEGNLIQVDNYLLLRCNLIDFWRLAAEANWQLHSHYLLYPNPWPKLKHYQRRWYAHPVLACLLELGGKLEVRSNWAVYIEEFAHAINNAGYAVSIQPLSEPSRPVSPFETKYLNSGHTLSCLNADLNQKMDLNNQKTGSL